MSPETGAYLGMQPDLELCEKCGLGVESHITDPASRVQQRKDIISKCHKDRAFKGAFLLSSEFISDPDKRRDWSSESAVTQTVTGSRMEFPVAFVEERIFIVRLGMEPAAAGYPTITLVNENFDEVTGVVCRLENIPDDVPHRRLITYIDQQKVSLRVDLEHRNTIRKGQSQDTLHYNTKKTNQRWIDGMRPTAGTTQSWQAMKGHVEKVEMQRLDALRTAAANTGGGGGGNPTPPAAVVMSSRLSALGRNDDDEMPQSETIVKKTRFSAGTGAAASRRGSSALTSSPAAKATKSLAAASESGRRSRGGSGGGTAGSSGGIASVVFGGSNHQPASTASAGSSVDEATKKERDREINPDRILAGHAPGRQVNPDRRLTALCHLPDSFADPLNGLATYGFTTTCGLSCDY